MTLYSQGNQIAGGPLTTNNEGRVTFGNLPSGNYSAVITGVPEGYTMDLTTMPVFIEPNKDIDRTFTATIKASLTIYAEDELGNALSNCEQRVLLVRRDKKGVGNADNIYFLRL